MSDSLANGLGEPTEQRIQNIVARDGAAHRDENRLTIMCGCGYEVRDEARTAIAAIRAHRHQCSTPRPATTFERRRKV